MTTPSPEVYVLKTDDLTDTGVDSRVRLKLVYEDGHIYRVDLTADEAQVLGMALQMRAAEVKPELVGL